MKLFIFSIMMLVGVSLTALIINLLRSFVTFIIPPLSSYPVASFVVAFALLIVLCLLAGCLIERCAVEYPYDDNM
jgi:hypothetical protein